MTSRMDRRFVAELKPEQYDVLVEWLRNRNAGAESAADEWTLQQAFLFLVERGTIELGLELPPDSEEHA